MIISGDNSASAEKEIPGKDVLNLFRIASIHAQIYGLAPYVYTLIPKVLFCLLYGIPFGVCKAFPYSRLNVLGEVLPGLILVEYFHAANVCAL